MCAHSGCEQVATFAKFHQQPGSHCHMPSGACDYRPTNACFCPCILSDTPCNTLLPGACTPKTSHQPLVARTVQKMPPTCTVLLSGVVLKSPHSSTAGGTAAAWLLLLLPLLLLGACCCCCCACSCMCRSCISSTSCSSCATCTQAPRTHIKGNACQQRQCSCLSGINNGMHTMHQH